tara:strand:+ start:297 stop:1232 length:936 start_codon:yes stop_codon:yes gene_type:complete
VSFKVLIIGGSGYLGSTLSSYLLENTDYYVDVIDNLFYKQNSLNLNCKYKQFSFEFGDFTDPNYIKRKISQYDIIIPLAAIVGAPACDLQPSYTKLLNYDSYLNLSKNLSKDQLLIFPTTNSGYGVGGKKQVTEESPLKPISSYAKLKNKIEKVFLEDNSVVSLRLATVFGVSPRMRDDLLVNDFVKKSCNDGYIVLFQENFRRNFIHVIDVAKTFHFSILNFHKMKNQSYNVGLSSANLTKIQLAKKIKKYIPNLQILSSNYTEDPDKRDYIVSNKKLESLGWVPSQNIDDGINELIKYYNLIINKNSNI